jgi:hypothetical protein
MSWGVIALKLHRSKLPTRDGQHFTNSAAREAAQSSPALHLDKQSRATFPPTKEISMIQIRLF